MGAVEDRLHAAAMRLFASTGGTTITISDLAAAAGVARGTVYANVGSVDDLFARVRSEVATQMHARNVDVLDRAQIADSAHRIATGIRLVVRIAHDEPDAARFMVRFGLSDESLRALLTGPPLEDIRQGVADGRYDFRPTTEISVVSLLMGAVVSAMWMVLEGHQTWREAGTGAAGLSLVALGVDRNEALRLADAPLPDL